MLRFYYNHSRALTSTPSYRFMPTKITCTVITSRNANISTLDPHNSFLADFLATKFDENSYIYVNMRWPQIAPKLNSLQKGPLLRIPPNANAKHETLTFYWSTKMDNVKLELLTNQ